MDVQEEPWGPGPPHVRYKVVNLEDQPTWIWEQINYPRKPGSAVNLKQWRPALVKVASSIVHDGWSLSARKPL